MNLFQKRKKELEKGEDREGGEKEMGIVNRPSADVSLSIRPRTSLKLREKFDTFGGAATLKLGCDYVYDSSSSERHTIRLKSSLCDNFINAKMLYSQGEVH